MKHAVIVVLIGLTGCFAAKTTDPETNVSIASYRQCLQVGQQKLANVKARFDRACEDDQLLAQPAHSRGWWQAQLDVVSDVMTLNSATLIGAAETAPTTVGGVK